jgi:hypothetical protein
MYIPIVNYEITPKDVLETIIGGFLIVISLIISIIFVNKITKMLAKCIKLNNTNSIIFILFINIIIILLFLMLIRYIADQVITNKLILNSAFSFLGPAIGASSLYFSSNIKTLVDLTL